MTSLFRSCLVASLLIGATVSPASGQRLTLAFLPPDLPPGNVCNIEIEEFDEDETQVADDGDAPEVLDVWGRLRYMSRDIRNLRRDEPDRAFDYIMALIAKRAKLHEKYAGFEADFERVDTYLAADRLDELAASGLIETLTQSLTELSWAQTVRLSRFYLNGIGVAQNRDFAMNLILDQAYLGNADALIEVLRMQLRGEEVADWTLPPEETARLGFGGLIGRTNRGMCGRAERMAREYLDGDLLTPNPDLAYAWRKFAADMGGADAAWRVVEHHLNAPADEMNEAALNHYLQQAVANGAVILPETVEDVIESGVSTEAEVRRLLGLNAAYAGSTDRSSAVPYLELDVTLTPEFVAEDGEYLQYLREVSQMPEVPGSVLTRLAKEIMFRKGRWKATEEVTPILQDAVRLGDPEAMRLLAEIFLSERGDPIKLAQAETLLIAAVERYGDTNAMKALDTFYRCQVPDAPRLDEANFWADAYRTADVRPISVAANDLARFDPRREPEAVARIQSLALLGHAGSTADWLQFLQSDQHASETALRYWAYRVGRSNLALERFVQHEFELSQTTAQRDNAVELFRRAHLDIGPAISLELAVALVEDAGRDPHVAADVVALLESSARRGEGAAMRLLQQLTKRDIDQMYAEYADVIEARGDFVSLAFFASMIPAERFDAHMDRAISLMSCSTKDIAELSNAYGAKEREADVMHWVQVGLNLEHGNSLMRLRLSDAQIDGFDIGLSIAEDMVGQTSSGDPMEGRRLRQLYQIASNPQSPDYDEDVAVDYLTSIFNTGNRSEYRWALEQYRAADSGIRTAVDARVDIRTGLADSATSGDPVAQYEYGLLLRHLAQSREELADSTEWLAKAANGGLPEAMLEYAQAIGYGIGREADPKTALIWLDRAEGLSPGRSGVLRTVFSAMIAE